MNSHSNTNLGNPLLKAVINFFNKLLKSNDDYPVKYYKKDKQFLRNKRA